MIWEQDQRQWHPYTMNFDHSTLSLCAVKAKFDLTLWSNWKWNFIIQFLKRDIFQEFFQVNNLLPFLLNNLEASKVKNFELFKNESI